MTPTPEATEALATALDTVFDPEWLLASRLATAILAAFPPGTVVTTVDDVARRLHERCYRPTHKAWHHTAVAKHLLGVSP